MGNSTDLCCENPNPSNVSSSWGQRGAGQAGGGICRHNGPLTGGGGSPLPQKAFS